MRFSDAQVRLLRESATRMAEENPGIDVHFAQVEEDTPPVTTVRYDEDPPTGAYVGEQVPDPQLLDVRAQQVILDVVAEWKALGVPRPAVRDLGHSELGGRSVRKWTVTVPGL